MAGSGYCPPLMPSLIQSHLYIHLSAFIYITSSFKKLSSLSKIFHANGLEGRTESRTPEGGHRHSRGSVMSYVALSQEVVSHGMGVLSPQEALSFALAPCTSPNSQRLCFKQARTPLCRSKKKDRAVERWRQEITEGQSGEGTPQV